MSKASLLRSKNMRSVFILIIGLFLIVNLTRSILELVRAADKIKEAEKQVAQLQFKNDELKKRLAEVQSPKYLEKIAREKLGLAKKGEVVVILPPYQPSAQVQEENLPNWKKWLRLFF